MLEYYEERDLLRSCTTDIRVGARSKELGNPKAILTGPLKRIKQDAEKINQHIEFLGDVGADPSSYYPFTEVQEILSEVIVWSNQSENINPEPEKSKDWFQFATQLSDWVAEKYSPPKEK